MQQTMKKSLALFLAVLMLVLCTPLAFAKVYEDMPKITAPEKEGSIFLGYYTVTFKSWDGNTVLKEETVAEGSDATPPEIPARISDADYHYTPGEWTGYTNITEAVTLLAPYIAEEHTYSGYNCSVCGRLKSTSMVVMNYYKYYVIYYGDLLAFIEGSEAVFDQALSDHDLSGSAYTDAAAALRAKAMQDMGVLLGEEDFYALGKDAQWHSNRFNEIKWELQAGLDEIVNLGVFSKTKEEQTKAAEELALPGDSTACETLIATAQAAIDALEYDRNQSLDDNVAAVEAVVTALEADLTAQREAEAQAAADQAAADAVEAKIVAIGKVENTDESKAKIDEARAAYDALTPAQQALVENADVLTAAEARYAKLKAEAQTPEEPVQRKECPICGKLHNHGLFDALLGEFHWWIYTVRRIITSFAKSFTNDSIC